MTDYIRKDKLTIDFSEYKYELELHAHSAPVSPCSKIPPEELVKIHADRGIDGFVLTNHLYNHNTALFDDIKDFAEYYNNNYYEVAEAGKKYGVKVWFGVEIYFGAHCDYLVYGAEPEDTLTMCEYFKRGSLEEFSRDFFTDGVKLLIQAHPFRERCLPAEPSIMDGYEIINNHQNHNSAPGPACRLAAENPDKIFTGGSDLHIDSMPISATVITKELPATSAELAKLLRRREHLISSSGQITIPVSFGMGYYHRNF